MSTEGLDSYNVYCYPIRRHFWFGWIMSMKPNSPISRFDNIPNTILMPAPWVDYVTFGFSKEAVTKKLRRRYEKLKNIHSKH